MFVVNMYIVYIL